MKLFASSALSITAGVGALCALAVTPLGASAAEPATPAPSGNTAAEADSQTVLEELVVTAQKRAERLQDVPISISVLSGSDLDRSTLVSAADALNRTPGVVGTVAVQGGGTQVAMRGVGASGPLFNGSSPIGYYLDSVPFGLVTHAVAPDQNPYDLERIEVLRGPQGTLYGAGGEGGVVRVITHDADLDRLEFKGRASSSSTRDGGMNYGGDAAVNVPIIPGKLAARAVLGYQDLAGWVDAPAGKDFNDAILRNYRLRVAAQPTDRLSIGISAWLTRNDTGAQSASFADRTSSSTTLEPQETDYDAYGLHVGYEFEHVSLSSVTSYLKYSNVWDSDATRFGLPNFRIFLALDADIFSEELLLTSKTGGPWRWTAGLFYRNAEDTRLQLVPPGDILFTDDGQGSESAAVFGELTRIMLDGRLELTLGGRYFRDDVFNEVNSEFTPVPGVPLYHAEDSFHATTPRVVLTWHPSNELTAYGSYSQGFRSGFPQNAVLLDFPAVKPDKLYNYEVGSKGQLLDGRVSFDTAVYYIDWQDIQQTLGQPFVVGGVLTCCRIVPVNGDSASGVGVDAGLTFKPVQGLEIATNFSWNDLTFDAPLVTGNTVVVPKGGRPNFSSKYTATASVDYEFNLSAALTGRLFTSASYSSSQVNRLLDPSGGPPVVLQGDDLLVARAGFSIGASDRWLTTLFVDNLTDEDGGIPGTSSPLDLTPRLRPRTVGLQVSYQFK